jgi:hypothetical protein
MELYELPVTTRVHWLEDKFPQSTGEARRRCHELVKVLPFSTVRKTMGSVSVFDVETDPTFWVNMMYRLEAKINGNIAAVLWNKRIDSFGYAF